MKRPENGAVSSRTQTIAVCFLRTCRAALNISRRVWPVPCEERKQCCEFDRKDGDRHVCRVVHGH